MDGSSTIQIYNGAGTSPVCSRAWKREIETAMDPRYHKVELFNEGNDFGFERGNVALVVIPGGNAMSMKMEIRSLAQKIHTAVNQEASFIGSCAGAIVCSQSVMPSQSRIMAAVDLTLESHLNLNPLPLKVPYYAPYLSPSDVRNRCALDVTWMPSAGHHRISQCVLFHAYGPVFPISTIPSKESLSTRVLASYASDGSESAAALLYRPSEKSKSRMIFTGVHPEVGLKDMASLEFSSQFNDFNWSHLETLNVQLQESEEIRTAMCRSWLSEVNLKIIPEC